MHKHTDPACAAAELIKEQLEAALDYAREGDALVVIKLDRLARSVAHLIAIGERLDAKGVSLKVLEQAIDTATPTGRLMFNMLGAIAQFERELMLERQREGVAKAKAEGKYKGRAPTARAKLRAIAAPIAGGQRHTVESGQCEYNEKGA
jgi:DNA invertase Pin-like site-specific DNA recombinase